MGKKVFIPLLAWVFCFCAQAEIQQAIPAPTLQQQLDALPSGASVVLSPGYYQGNFVVNKPLTILGNGEVVLSGQGKGRVITIDAADVTLSGLIIEASGDDLSREDAGIFVTAKGANARIVGNQVRQNLIGIYLKGPSNARVENNIIEGRSDLRVNERGNGVHLWNTPGSEVIGNRITQGRDGIFVTTSKNNRFLNNEMWDLRFAVHYMYTNHSEVSGNLSRNNHIGYAIMYSHHLTVTENHSVGDRDHGIMLNYTNNSLLQNNWVDPPGDSEIGEGPEKCVFMYNANFNELLHNRFQRCQIGIHFTAGSQGNTVAANSFAQNRRQVKYVGSRFLEWSRDGRGNYWSDNLGFDLNGDGLSDRPYRPNDMVDQLMWRYPLSKLLLNSPAVELLRWSQSQFPGFYPGGVVDSYPMMNQPLAAKEEAAYEQYP